MSRTEPVSMPDKDYRALLTEREAEILRGDADVSDGYYYRVVTRVRDKIERLEADLRLLDAHHEDLAGELREAVGSVAPERAESDETPAHGDGEAFDTDDLRGDPTTALDDETGEPSALEETIDAVADDVLPGSGSKLEARREALRAVVEHLREHGSATPAEFKEEIYPEHPAAYTDGEDPAYSWWTNCMYKGVAELAERTDAVESADTSGTWRFNDDA